MPKGVKVNDIIKFVHDDKSTSTGTVVRLEAPSPPLCSENCAIVLWHEGGLAGIHMRYSQSWFNNQNVEVLSEMSLEDFRKKYGTEAVILMIDHLLYKVTLSPYAAAQYDELKQDLRALLTPK